MRARRHIFLKVVNCTKSTNNSTESEYSVINKKLDELALNCKHVCDELDEKIKHIHTVLSEKEGELVEQLETLFNCKQEELVELQMDHEDDKEPFKVKSEVKPEVLVFGDNSGHEEAFAEFLGPCLYRVCADAPLSLLHENFYYYSC